jgi:hypothetical protein
MTDVSALLLNARHAHVLKYAPLKGYPEQNETFSRITDAKRWAQQTESAIREWSLISRAFNHLGA